MAAHVRRAAGLLRRPRHGSTLRARAHRERLAALAAEGRLLAAGPWADDSGALLVFAVDSRTSSTRSSPQDPYYAAPGVTVASVQEWNPVTRHPALAEV